MQASAEPVNSPGFAEIRSTLRPPETRPAVAALETAPLDPAKYAEAALAYAGTEVPVMTLLWAMSYQALGGGKSEPAVSQAFLRVLTERIIVKPDAQNKKVDYNVRLAPGEMPVRTYPDGSVDAPLAYAFEGMFGATVVGFQPPWSIEQFYDVLSAWVGVVSTRGTPLDEKLELDGWLVGLAKAGHLEAYCYRLLGSALPAELKAYKQGHAAELKAFDEYVKGSGFKPTRAVMPDDLVRLH